MPSLDVVRMTTFPSNIPLKELLFLSLAAVCFVGRENCIKTGDMAGQERKQGARNLSYSLWWPDRNKALAANCGWESVIHR